MGGVSVNFVADLMSSLEFMWICTHLCAFLQYKAMFDE